MIDRAAVARYLRQVAELGGSDLFLDSLDRDRAMALAVGPTQASPGGSTPRTGVDALRHAVSDDSDEPPIPQRPAELRRPAATSDRATAPPVERPASAARVADPATIRKLAELSAIAAGCTLCRLHETRTKVVFGEGSASADLVVVGEAPGGDEDRTGRPFVGRAGRLLDLMLLAAGFPRDEVYICNVLKCRPPGNRNPQADEMDTCTRNFLHGQLELIAPRMLLAVGRFAVQALLESTAPIGRLRGRVHAYRGIPLVVSYHPAYLLRSPNMIRTAWADYQLIRRVLDEPV